MESNGIVRQPSPWNSYDAEQEQRVFKDVLRHLVTIMVACLDSQQLYGIEVMLRECRGLQITLGPVGTPHERRVQRLARLSETNKGSR